MAEFDDVREKCPVPDPGPDYWAGFARRVHRRIDEAAAPLRSVAARALRGAFLGAAAAAAVVAWALVLFGPVEEPPPPASASPALSDPARTARIAARPGFEETLAVLSRSAAEKMELARRALENGDPAMAPPLLRSYERLLRDGLMTGVERALEKEEDVLPAVERLREAAAAGLSQATLLAAAPRDPECLRALEGAAAAARDLDRFLSERFQGHDRG